MKNKNNQYQYRYARKQKLRIAGALILAFLFGASSVVNGYFIHKSYLAIEAKAEWAKSITAPIVVENPVQLNFGTNSDVLADPCALEVVLCDGEARTASRVSSYNAEEGQTDSDPYTMASGKRVFAGAVANNCLEFGTKVHLEGLGEFEVQDRMNSRYGCDTFDIFRWDKSENVTLKDIKYTIL